METTMTKTLSAVEIENRIKSIIETSSSIYLHKHEDGYYSMEMYADYRDEIGSESIKKIFSSETPKDTFYDVLYEAYEFTEMEYFGELMDAVMKDFDDEESEIYGNDYEDEIRDWLQEYVCIDIPLKHYLNQSVCTNIYVDTGDGNYDFGLNNQAVYYASGSKTTSNDAAVIWLTKQQRYTKTDFNNAIFKEDYKNDSKFLKSMETELYNACSSMNVLIFCVEMTIEEMLNVSDSLKQFQSTDESKEHRYHPKRIKSKDYIVLDKSTSCGLFNPWSGAGSMLDIELEKDVKLPYKFIWDIEVDGCGWHGYGVDDVYGMCGDFWTRNGLKEIKSNYIAK